MKNIGVLNFQHSNNNYGAVLQAAALEYCLNIIDDSFIIEHINFIPTYKVKYNPIKTFIGDLLRKIGLKEKKPLKTNFVESGVFSRFRDSWLRVGEPIRNNNDLIKVKNKYDYVIVGSDQVWRPAMTKEYCLTYFFDFIDNKTKKISYAASFGIDYWDEKYNHLIPLIEKELSNFHAISVREKSGIDICNKTFNQKAIHVLDPTLLAGRDFFEEIIKDKKNKEYDIVYYKLDLDIKTLADLESLSKRRNYSLKNIYANNIDGLNYFNEVDDWIYSIKTSKLVITDSFHCICFAILFNKQFIYLPNKGRGMSRLESLLSLLKLEDRICYDNNILKDKYIENIIDYNIVNNKLKSLRLSSYDFLKNAFL